MPGLIIKVNTELTATDKLLDENELFCMIRNDLARRHPQTDSRGRKSTPVEVLLRMMAVKHPYDFGYEKTKQQVANSLVLSQFYRVYFHAVPDHTTLWCWAQLIQPGTLAVFLQ